MKKARIAFPFFLLLTWVSCGEITIGELIPSYTVYTKNLGTEYLEVLVYGDAGKGNASQQLVADEMQTYVVDASTEIDFIINLGDSFYDDGVDSVSDPLWNLYFENVYDSTDLNMPFYSILGNHDWIGNIQAQLDYVSPNNDRWQMPSRYYAVSETLPDTTEIDFFFLDTISLKYGDLAQLQWLDDQLDQSTARWKIVSGHHPLFSFGDHGFDGDMISRLQPLLNNRADLYIAGHEHDLQILAPQNDVWYLIDGSAGGSRPVGIGDISVFAAARSGFMVLIISYDHLVCQVLEAGTGLIYNIVLKDKS